MTEAAGKPDDLSQLAKGGRTNVAGFFIRLIARLPFLWVAAQWYGATQMGRLAIAIVVVEFAAQVSTLGLKRGLALHMAGESGDNGAWDGALVVLGATLIPTIGLMLFPQAMFPNSTIKPLDYLLPLTIPAIALSDVMIAALAFRGNINAGVFARAVIEPWTISLAALALWWWVPSDGLLVSYALSMGAALLFSAVPFFREFGVPKDWQPRPVELYTLARTNAPLVAADAIEWGSRRLDVFLLGLFVSPATIGIYWVAQQIASLPQKLKTSFDPVLGPAITRKLKEGDRAGVAKQICQVGFWVIAAQLGVALALGIPGEALMAVIGPKRDFVGGNGALAFLLSAEVVAAAAVVSEAALIYVARHQNMALSLAMIAVQAVLTVGLLLMLEARGYPELWQAAAAALSLACALLAGSVLKTRLAAKRLGAPVSIWRWQLIPAALLAGMVGGVATQGPQWSELLVGIPAILGTYFWFIWRFAFRAEDRLLFKKV